MVSGLEVTTMWQIVISHEGHTDYSLFKEDSKKFIEHNLSKAKCI